VNAGTKATELAFNSTVPRKGAGMSRADEPTYARALGESESCVPISSSHSFERIELIHVKEWPMAHAMTDLALSDSVGNACWHFHHGVSLPPHKWNTI
jgi:hypothetical protein